jgi:nicotinic acid mononucleotide adenylyltransferase
MLPIIVMARPLQEGLTNHTEWAAMTELIHTQISDAYQFSNQKDCYLHHRYQPIYRQAISMLDISATKIRQLVRQNRSIRFLVPQSVENYILKQGIYA